ncbi:hypothetical protein PRIPAC_97623 [Pristionchus pacificus]|uniref:Uncharacterized protein n=1 Tax=Pristionchus pacificus TaxID=54126 RepID=A0A2A6CUK8_PRIPA|nr:hypothetical protein PRIPAC_97623 [Pristionchus pacificus]|eukprot:PDM81780.1 hypothetical protein PRIPAC_37622 [Pristionchus pacificus]
MQNNFIDYSKLGIGDDPPNSINCWKLIKYLSPILIALFRFGNNPSKINRLLGINQGTCHPAFTSTREKRDRS